MSISSLLSRQITQLQTLGMGTQMMQQLGREGFFVGSLDQLTDPADHVRLSRLDTQMILAVATALIHGGPGIPEDTAPRNHYVNNARPVLLEDIDRFAEGRFRLFDPTVPKAGPLTIVKGERPRFLPPPAIALATQDRLDVLQWLEYAGVHYTDPRSPAAEAGYATYLTGRNYVLDRLEKMEGTGTSADWIGFDWDFTTDVYRIYGELLPLISLKLFGAPPTNADNKFIRVLEAAKPGMHELIVGMMAGYAIKQGLLLFSQWENYLPQVRVVTQTWPERLSVLANDHVRLLPLMMGSFPGLDIPFPDVLSSRAFITLENFLREADALLEDFRESKFQFQDLDPAQRDDLIAILRTGKGHVIKSVGAFEAARWAPPTLIFDDGPVTNARLRQAGVDVIQVPNPLAPGKEMSDLKVVTLQGRRAAFRQMVQMLSQSEAPAVVETLRQGARSLDLQPSDTTPVLEGTIVVLHDTRRSLDAFFREFEEPKRRMKRKIRKIVKDAGGLAAVERNYRDAVSKDPS